MQVKAVFFAELREKIGGKLGRITGPLPEWRQDERDHTDPVIEVRPEFLLFDEVHYHSSHSA